jgi:hypothetical protein
MNDRTQGTRASHWRRTLLIVLLSGVPALAGAPTEAGTMPDPLTGEALALMDAFAARTGLDSARTPRRYLWTDAFAVCNYLGLARATGDPRYTERALQLADQVHHTLGRHRGDDSRTGWISGLSGDEAERHPTRGGLRIGKPLPERRPDEAADSRLEWERDGQYFHYLTQWMHALDQLAHATQESRFNAWARELAQTAFDAFTYQPAPAWQPRRMVWKMSIDLKRVLIPSMGQLDPLDGYLVNLQLRATAATLPPVDDGPTLDEATRQYARMMKPDDWMTTDPLGLGSLLVDAWRVRQLSLQGIATEDRLLDQLLDTALAGLQRYAQSGELNRPADERLAFRELGLAIGLHAVDRVQQSTHRAAPDAAIDSRQHALLRALVQYLPLGDSIEAYWRDPEHRQTDAWLEHEDINAVMLATALAPDGYLGPGLQDASGP